MNFPFSLINGEMRHVLFALDRNVPFGECQAQSIGLKGLGA